MGTTSAGARRPGRGGCTLRSVVLVVAGAEVGGGVADLEPPLQAAVPTIATLAKSQTTSLVRNHISFARDREGESMNASGVAS